MRHIFHSVINFFCSYCHRVPRGPVRRLFSTGLVAALGFGLVAAVAMQEDGSRLLLVTEDETVVVGERFFVDVMVDADDPVNAVDLVLEYPEHKMDIIDLREGESVISLWAEDPFVEDEFIYLSGGTFRRGFSGEHRIISISARATESGVIRIEPQDVQLLAGDGSGDEVATDIRSMDTLRLYAVRPGEVEGREGGEGGESEAAADGSGRPTDLTSSGRVTMQDISIFMSAWNNRSPVYDFTGDGRMTFRDFSILLADFFLGR